MRHTTKLLLVLPLFFGISAGSPQAQLTEYNFNRATSAMISSNSRAAKVSQVRGVPSVTVIRLRQRVIISFDINVQAIEISAQKNAFGISRVRSALNSNPATRAALAAKGVPIGRIVAIDVFSNGSLRVYIL